MATDFVWQIQFREICRWKIATKDDIFESDVFSMCGAKWKLICSSKDTNWDIHVKCLHINSSKRKIRVNCQIICTDQNDKNITDPMIKKATFRAQQCSKAWCLTTSDAITKCSRLKISCMIQETESKVDITNKYYDLSRDELIKKLIETETLVENDQMKITAYQIAINRQKETMQNIRTQLKQVRNEFVAGNFKLFQFDEIITEPYNENILSPVEISFAADQILYDKHIRDIQKWNKNSVRLQEISLLDDKTLNINIDDDEKKDNEINCFGLKLFKTYSECSTIMNEQSTYLSEVTTKYHLLELINHQNALSKSIKGKELKSVMGLKEYNAQTQRYEILKQQRIELQNKIKIEFKQCNEMIHEENKLFHQRIETSNSNNNVLQEIEKLKSSSISCVSVIKLYNDFMENNKKYIEQINIKFDTLWNEFESKWMKWSVDDIIAWFKYKTITMNTDKINWGNTDKQLRNRNITGKSLVNFNNLVFELIGIQDFDIVTYLVSQIQILNQKYDGKNRKSMQKHIVRNMVRMEIPKEYLCPITKQIMRDPVMAFDGHSYDRNAIESYLKINKTSPITGATADYIIVFPNHKLKADIQQYVKTYNIDLEPQNEGISEGNKNETAHV